MVQKNKVSLTMDMQECINPPVEENDKFKKY